MEIDWAKALGHVSPTPDGHQDWVDADYARSLLRCSDDQISRLRASGIQTREGRFDRSDLWNASLHSGTGTSRPELEMRFFGAAVSPRRDWTEPTGYRISLVAACPRGDDCTGDRWERPRIPAARWHTSELAVGEARWTGRITLTGHRDTVRSTKAREIWREFIDVYSFHYLFMREEQSPKLTRARKVGDCTALSVALNDVLRDHGLSSRVRDGFMFAGREARSHRWVECRDDDGEWKNLDPSMAILSRTFFTPEYADFCRGSLLNRVVRVAHGDTFHVRHWCAEGGSSLQPVVTLHKIH